MSSRVCTDSVEIELDVMYRTRPSDEMLFQLGNACRGSHQSSKRAYEVLYVQQGLVIMSHLEQPASKPPGTDIPYSLKHCQSLLLDCVQHITQWLSVQSEQVRLLLGRWQPLAHIHAQHCCAT